MTTDNAKIEEIKQRRQQEQRLNALERATGAGEKPEKGIAHRLDDLEERIEKLEEKVGVQMKVARIQNDYNVEITGEEKDERIVIYNE